MMEHYRARMVVRKLRTYSVVKLLLFYDDSFKSVFGRFFEHRPVVGLQQPRFKIHLQPFHVTGRE